MMTYVHVVVGFNIEQQVGVIYRGSFTFSHGPQSCLQPINIHTQWAEQKVMFVHSGLAALCSGFGNKV